MPHVGLLWRHGINRVSIIQAHDGSSAAASREIPTRLSCVPFGNGRPHRLGPVKAIPEGRGCGNRSVSIGQASEFSSTGGTDHTEPNPAPSREDPASMTVSA